MKRIANPSNIAILDIFYERWPLLKNSELYWKQKLCMLEELIDELENTVPINVDTIFFESLAEKTLGETRKQFSTVWPSTTVSLPFEPKQF